MTESTNPITPDPTQKAAETAATTPSAPHVGHATPGTGTPATPGTGTPQPGDHVPGTEKAVDEIKVKAEELFELIKKNAGPLFSDLRAKVEPLLADLKEKAPQYLDQAKQKAQPLINDVSAKIDEVRNKNSQPTGAGADDVQTAAKTVSDPGVSTPGETSAASTGGTTSSVADAHQPGTSVDGTPGTPGTTGTTGPKN